MRVMHYESQGVGIILSKALRDIGVDSFVVSTAPHPYGFEPDYLIPTGTRWKDFKAYRKIKGLLKRYDIFHSHSHVLPPLSILKHFKGLFIQHWHSPVGGPIGPDGTHYLTSMPLKGGEWLPIPVDTKIFRPSHIKTSVRIGYSAVNTDPQKAKWIPLEQIYQTALPAQLCPQFQVVPHDEMPSYYQTLDIWVDRIGLGFYGFQAIEAAACGVAIITQMDWAPQGCPFINVPRGEVAKAIHELVRSPSHRRKLQLACRQYAVNMHDSRKVAKQCLEFYEKAISGKR